MNALKFFFPWLFNTIQNCSDSTMFFAALLMAHSCGRYYRSAPTLLGNERILHWIGQLHSVLRTLFSLLSTFKWYEQSICSVLFGQEKSMFSPIFECTFFYRLTVITYYESVRFLARGIEEIGKFLEYRQLVP